MRRRVVVILLALPFVVSGVAVGLSGCGSDEALIRRTLTADEPEPDPEPGVAPAACPAGYLGVRSSAAYGVDGFCVAQYEMKIVADDDGNQAYDANFVAEPRVSGTPWANIARADAIAECQALGAGYDLITNDEWQVLAREIELVDSNWSGGKLSQGNSDRDPLAICDAAHDNVNTNCATAGGVVSQKRTHLLASGELIWDLAGNGWEWVRDDFDADDLGTASNTSIHLLTDDVKTEFGTYGEHVTEAGLGMFEHEAAGAGKTGTLRGGDFWFHTSRAGIFAAHLNADPAATSDSWVFRCVYRP